MANDSSRSQQSTRITSDMVLTPQSSPKEGQAKVEAIPSAPKWRSPQLLIVFEDGDLHSARQQLLHSLQNPFAEGSVATLLLQESIAEQFVGLVARDLRTLPQEVAKNPTYISTLAKIDQLKAKVVRGESLKAGESPILVYDCVHSYLGGGATGVVTLHTFRTAKEAGELAKRDPLPYGQVSLWNEKLACAYELIPRLPADVVAINCFSPDLSPIRDSFKGNRNEVLLEKNYHYESLVVSGKRRIVVFPVGTIFAN
ncbi:uncharacterized protein LOC108024355 [Drosophila biarmipes]|uniref:uncharacterized protein LOC108024355 n=1 Tax=Drosophila biarmipes TaxID=125945 RepID=UPI0007E889F9|nr:uncharacterized protein LOC108024355 [Drosophila biarmipes]